MKVANIFAAIHSQLTVLTQPEALVNVNSSVVEGSVIQIYCIVENDTTVTFTWTLNGTALLNDPPHIRLRQDNLPIRSASLLTDDSTSVLTVDNFRDTDNGVYQCTATNGTASSGSGNAVALTGLNPFIIAMSNAIDQEWFKQPSSFENDFEDNRTGIALDDYTPQDLLKCAITFIKQPPSPVVWIRNGQAVQDTDLQTNLNTTNTGLLTSSLVITNFTAADAGVYQCVFTENAKVITSIPHRLDTGKLPRSTYR